MGHNVGVAADRAVKNSQRTIDSAKTPEQRFKEIRSGLSSGLFVTPDNQRFLLAQYDAAVVLISELRQTLGQNTAIVQSGIDALNILGTENAKLHEENDQFRTVYEQENSSRGTVIVVADAPVPQPEA